MVQDELSLRREIVEVGRWIWQKGWVAANDGNISVRLDDRQILCTPTGVSKGMMSPEDLILVDRQGNKLAGERERTTEIAMHLTVYDMRPEVRAVVHAHPPVATGFAAAGRGLNLALLPEVVVGLGSVPLAGYGLPGTEALSEAIRPFIPKYDALLLMNHGATCYGEDLRCAYFRMETVEHFARITLVTELLGGARVLPRSDVQALVDSRTRYGVKSQNGLEPGSPLTAEDLPEREHARPEISRELVAEWVEELLRAKGVV